MAGDVMSIVAGAQTRAGLFIVKVGSGLTVTVKAFDDAAGVDRHGALLVISSVTTSLLLKTLVKEDVVCPATTTPLMCQR